MGLAFSLSTHAIFSPFSFLFFDDIVRISSNMSGETSGLHACEGRRMLVNTSPVCFVSRFVREVAQRETFATSTELSASTLSFPPFFCIPLEESSCSVTQPALKPAFFSPPEPFLLDLCSRMLLQRYRSLIFFSSPLAPLSAC